MRSRADRAAVKPASQPLVAATLIVSGLLLCGPTTFSMAETVPDNVAKQPFPASDKIAAIKADISRAIASYGKDIHDAYYRELIVNPKIDGEIIVSFTVRPDGDIADVKVDRSSLNAPLFEEEILNRIGTWKFPPFEGDPIPATVPYEFRPN